MRDVREIKAKLDLFCMARIVKHACIAKGIPEPKGDVISEKTIEELDLVINTLTWVLGDTPGNYIDMRLAEIKKEMLEKGERF